MLNDSQQRKALVLSLLMVMLAQTAYIEAYRGWKPPVELQEKETDVLRVGSPAVCSAASRTSGTEIHVDVAEGDDTYPGTSNCPKASLGAAVTLAASESASNPEIVLHAGLYHENVSVNNLDNLLIRAATGERVVFDGTRSIADDLGGVWGSADSDGIQEVTLTEDGWQLFLDHEEQVPARWPNAGFDDETVFNRSYWAEGTLTGSNNAYTIGWLTDAGPEAGVHTGLNETVNATGLDPVGAIAVMNLGSFRSNSRIITDWNPNNGTFAYDGTGVGWKTKHHAYFLEGKRELIDQDGEWWFNNTNNRLHYKAPSGQDANDLDLRVKVQPFAISVDGSDGVTVQGIDFFGTTVNFNNCDGCSFTNATLEYPSTSKRGLGIAGESEDDRWMTRFYRSKNSFVDRISITNTDGGAIEFQGSPGQTNNNTVNNSYFHAIDWSAADQKGLMVTIYEGGRDMYFTNNTVHLTGASSVLSIGDAPKVFYNEVWDVGHLQTDGAVVQVMQAEAPGAEIAYNWIHDIIKYGARFDAPIGQAGEGRNGTMHHNVIWNAAGGLMVKGDYHDIHNNTVFNSSGKNDMIILTDDGVNNGNSTIHQNAADKMADHRSDSWALYPLPAGTYWNNWNGYVNTTDSVWNQLVDPANQDFRPKVNSHLDNMSAGAYDAGVSNPWTAGISWTYTTPNAPVAGCMLDYADNYDADATLSDGSCLFASYTPPSTLDLRLHLDPTNSSSYSGSGTNVADLSGFDNNGTVAAAGPTWDADFTRFTYDGACTGSSGNYVCDEIEIEDSTSLRPGEPYEDLAVELNTGPTTQYLTAPSTTAGYTLGAVETSFTIQAWVKPTDCENLNDPPTILSKVYSFKIGCHEGTWHYVLGNGTAWYIGNWVDTGVPADNNVWQHVALTRAGSSTGVKFFLNGVQSYSVSSYEGDLGNNNNQSLYVGSRSGQYATSDAWHGLIDDVRIYTSDRSSTIVDDMNKYPNVDDQYLNAFFDFNLERDGDTITGISNIATGANASSSSLTSVTGSPKVVRTWDVSTVGSDTVLTFERTVLTAQGGWRVPKGVSSADVLIVGGGGGGGYNTGGGGGGGGVGFYNSTALTAGSSVAVVVGQGGQGSTTNTANGANGQASKLGTSVVGGGGGGAGWGSSGANGSDAPTGSPAFDKNGSGGGASNTGGGGGTGATNGGDGANDAGAGGGGAGDDGENAPSSNNGGDGGDGLNSSITGSLVMYGSGAGGGSWNTYGNGGAGAGDGGTSTAATHGTTNRGGGGGGGGGNSKEGANGGSGVVIVRYASVDHNDWSVATWINASSLQGSTIIGTYDDNGQSSDIGWALRIRSATGDLYATVGTTSNTSAAWTSDASIDTDRWYHVVMVADVGNTLRLYLDGVNVANGSLSGSGNLRDVSNNVFLGSYNGGEDDQPFDGQIGSVMAFADALNASNINQLYTAGKGVYSNTTNLSYAQSSSTLILGQTYSFPLTVANGEVTTSYSLSGTLPSGMNFESSNGTIWGTPTVTMTSTTYTVMANNSAGSYTTSISLTSQHVAPYDLVYSPENMTLTKGTAMTTNTPSVSGGTITSWEINPSVPTGLSFSTSTGAISGTPTVLQTTATTYTVWANNSGGSTSAQVNITIIDEAPNSLSYSPKNMTLTKGTTMTPNLPSVSGGAITSWEISPSLPSGLTWGTADGKISGTPTVLQTTTVAYTVWANNSGGSVSVQVNITINDQVPNALGYTLENMTLEKGTTMTTNTPSVSGGAVTSWEISPSLPTGLSFGSTNGSIWGTPTVLQTTAATYTIWANNSGGFTSAQVNITINDQIASISYSSPVEMSNNRPLSSTITPTNTGGAVTSWEITPTLPTGLTFGTTNGSIWGTPENVTSNATYTIYANNSGGSASATLTLNMNWTLTPSVDGAYITRNSSIGTDITWEWDYDPLEAIYAGLVTGEWNTCAIDDNGDVYCWGRNGNGQIGNGQSGTSACGTSGHKCKDIPTRTTDLGSDVVALAFGHQHACGLTDAGAVKCWGRNNNGQIGTSGGDVASPYEVSLGSGRTATSIYAGGHSTCAILDDGSTKCWGHNSDGQLGIGSTSNTNTPTTIGSLGSGRTAVSLAMAMTSVCALLDDGSVKCWGEDYYGQLGNGGSNTNINSPPASAINLGSGRTAKSITAGEYHFCAILDDNSIKCWGDGGRGKLGTGSTLDRSTPFATSGGFASGRYAVAIDAGYDHTCAILDNGDMTCWGSDADGQLGNGGITGDWSSLQSTTVNLGTGRTAISLSAGGTHTCAQLDNGQLKCWGNRADGQVGDNGGFNSPSDRTSPSTVSNNNYGGNTYADTGVFPSAAVTGATCAISPALPTGMSLTSGTCAITGTPTVTAVNATYTVWANISGQSFSGQVWLEVGLNVPIVSYSPSLYTYTKDTTISTIVPSNTGGEVTTWAINGSLPSGLSFGTSNGSIWGTPDTITASTTYTVWANNSAGSGSTTITLTVNDVAPSITFTPSSLILATGAAMTPITASNSGGSIVSCSVSPSLPSGLSLSNTCTLSGTPTVASSAATYTITATNTGGSDTATFSLTVQASGGTLTISPTSREGSLNSALANITMSYTHTASNYGWTSGVSNTTTSLATNFDVDAGIHWLGVDSGEQGELVVVYARKDSTTTTHSLALLYRWNGTWTETILDNGTNTGHHPSVAVDRQGAIHIAYIDDDNDKLRYATNASGSWVFTTLGNSTVGSGGGRGTALVVHPITDAVHIVATNYENSSRGLSYHTNEGGSWVNETITDTTKDEGHDPAMAMDGNGNLHVAYYCKSGCNDLRLSSRINGVWQNETVSSTNDIGQDPDIAIDSQGTIHIVSRYNGNGGKIYLHSGTPGSWTAQTGLSGAGAFWPVVEVDSNDAVHIAYHYASTHKDVMYMTNASGSWSTPSKIEEYGGWGSEIVIDANDDIFIPNIHPSSTTYGDELQLTTVKGSGQGLTALPMYDISPMLPDGLVMNWRNGTISGTPTEALANTSFTVTVTALGATTSGTFTLFITGEPGIIAYNDIQATQQTAITTATPSFTNNSTSGTTTSWAISPSLPSGLSFGTTNGSIWGTPTFEQIKTSYTVWANNTAGSSSTTINITIGPAAPGDFEYIPEDNELFNNSYAHLAPSFVNITTGNGTTWQVGSSDTNPGSNFAFNINGVVYFDAGSNEKLWAYSPGNNSSWKVNNTVTWVGEHMAYAVDDTIYFSGHTGGTGREFYAYNTTNQTMWLVSDIRSGSQNGNPGENQPYPAQDGDVLFFKAKPTNSNRYWYTYNHSNRTLTELDKGWADSGAFSEVIGDILYMRGRVGSGHAEVWAYSAVNATAWMIEDIYSGTATTGSEAGEYLHTVVNDILLFDAWSGVTNDPRSIWAYNPANATAWELQSADSTLGDNHVTTSSTACGQPLVVGDVAYFCATGGNGAGGYELWAYNTSNETTWLVTDIDPSGDSHPGKHMFEILGDTLYFSAAAGGTGIELWAYDTSNHSTWRVADINSGSFHSNPGQYMTVVVGDTLYFSAKTEATNQELFAYDTSNQSLWLVEDLRAGSQSSFVGENMALVAGNKLVFNAKPSGTTSYLYGHEPSEINWMTNTGGNVTTWAINNTNLPTGLTFSTSNGTIYGTPTQLWSKTAYMVWANNSGGSSVGYLNITVVDANLSYSKYDLTLTKDQASNDLPLNATTTVPGSVTTWEISSTLPAGLNFGTSNGTIWGIPTVLQTTASTYTIWANGTHGSVSASITLTIYDHAPGPFEYEPENNTWTNNTDVHLAPVFVNRTTGNGSTWQVADISNGQSSSHSAPGQNIHILVGDTIYFDAFEAATGTELWAYDTSNQSLWRVTDIRSGSGGSNPGEYSSILVGDTLYFSANDGSTGQELWAHNTSNHSTWQVEDIRSGSNTGSPGSNMMHVINGVLYFDAHDGNVGKELWKHDPSTGTTSRVYDINAGGTGSSAGKWLNMVVGDVLYFSATDGSTGSELWAYNTSNSSNPWRVMDINSGGTGSEPGMNMNVLVGDTIYFDAGATGGRELWAYNSSNQSTWRVVDIRTGSIGSEPGDRMALLVGDTIYFDADDGSTGSELWAHDTSNHSTWQVADIYVSAGSTPGSYMSILVGDTVYFSAFNSITGHELWAHDTSNHSTWQVADINPYLTMGGGESSNPGQYMAVSVGDTVYFSANDGSNGNELWAHDTSNHSTWQVVDIDSGLNGGTPGYWMEILVGDTLYFSADDGSTGHELWAHQPSRIDDNTNTGGAVTSWEINASLPSGVSFGTSNGTIYGTPTQLWTQTSYMVWANNSGGSSVAYLNITVVDDLPTLSYSLTSLNLTNNTVSSDLPLAPTLTGPGEITSWAINTSLPSGLSFGTTNGTIWGTPTEPWNQTAYTVWANNSGGSSAAYLNITVVDQVPVLSYSSSTLNLTNNTVSSDLPLVPTLTGPGEITSWAINTSLPSGLSFGTNNGTIYGTPTELWNQTAYTVWANNSGGSTVAYLNITVVDQLPSIAYSPNDLTLRNNTVSSDLPLGPSLTGSGEIVSWAINASLPSGVFFGTNNGTIYGTPTELWNRTSYMVWANNTGGFSVAYLNITVVDELPTLSYPLTAVILTNNTVSSDLPLNATLSGPGEITSWGINASLPSGLSFGTTNGTIYGTPTELWNQTAYTVWANNSGGSSAAYLNITVVDQLPVLSYSPTILNLTNNTVSSDLPLVPTLTGPGEITSWGMNATLPAGLSFGTNNGTIYGTPTELLTRTAYTIWANNSGGSSAAYLNITVVDELPALSYSPSALDLTNNTVSSDLPLVPTVAGAGEITSWFINASLPAGLSFGTNNGTIWGTPTELWPQRSYMVLANNSGGTSVAYLNITVVDELPTLSYSPSTLLMTMGNQSSDLPLNATLNGSGVIISWEINPTLPAGLSFGTGNGTIWGIPTVLQPTTTVFTVWANNTGGSTSATINITIIDEPPGPFEYTPENNTWSNNSYVNIGPSYINQTSGNGSTWQVANINSGSGNGHVGQQMNLLVGDALYFSADDGSTGAELWAHNTSNGTTWQVSDINSGSGSSNPGQYVRLLVGDTIYFSAHQAGTGTELWAHNTSNKTTWQVADIISGTDHGYPGWYMSAHLIGDTFYFDANSGGSTSDRELWAHNTSNGTTWRVADIYSGGISSDPGRFMSIVVGDTLYFDANDGSTGIELWAYDTSNQSTWRVADINSGGPSSWSSPGLDMSMLVGDTLYFSANDGTSGQELWAHDTSNHSTWKAADLNSGSIQTRPGQSMFILVGDTIYFDASTPTTGDELWAHDTSNHSTWQVADIRSGSGGSAPGMHFRFLVGDTLYFDANDGSSGTELWAHDTSNRSTWRVTDIRSGSGSSNPGSYLAERVGDTLYFSANDGTTGYEMWAHDTSNMSTWQVHDNNQGGATSNSLGAFHSVLVGDILYFTGNDGSTGWELWAHRVASVNRQTNTGGDITSWAINASLPSGLSFGTNNGTIFGTPTELWNQTSYMVWGNNSGGSTFAYLNITVVDQLPSITYTPNDVELTNNTVSIDLPLVPTLTGPGEITSWAINASLPSGVSFGTNNGTIYGTPTELWNRTSYMVWGNNSGGFVLAYLNITVVDQLPTVSYSPNTVQLINNTVSSDLPLTAMLAGPGVITSWAIAPDLPAGLSFGTNNGTIYGTATELWSQTAYTVWANNSGGSSQTYVYITVVDQIPTIAYTPNALILTNNTANSDLPLPPTLTGPGEITSWAIAPDLPAGLTFETSNGTIWGTPTELWSTTAYTVWGNNSGGSSLAYLNITVNDQVPTKVTYSPENVTMVRGEVSTDLPLLPALTGPGEIISWAINGSLPAGLTFESSNGTIWGMPLVNMTRTTYTVWANNSGGSVSTTLNITVLEPPVLLDYNPENMTLIRGVQMATLSPSVSGANASSWSIFPDLPAGLNFSDGVVSGTPTVNMTLTLYTVWANTSGGATSHTLNITVLEPIVVLDYNPENLTLIRGVQMANLFPSVLGGNVSTWSIDPSLPTGLNFSDGVISGTPTVNMTLSTYTVWANTSGGAASHTLNITILEPTGNLSYSPNNLTLTRGVAMSSLHPTFDGGVIEYWSVYPALPSGLNFSSGVISGTPTVNMTISMFTVYANNSGGSAAATINITILEPVVDLLYSPDNLTLLRGTTMPPLHPTVSGGNVGQWELVGVLPEGLNFSNGVFSGTPLVNMTQMQYLVYANTTGGSATAWVNITVLEPAVNLSYNPYNITLIRNETMSPLSPTVTGGNASGWAIAPELPAGLIFSDGVISGTPEVNMTTTMFTIWANTSGGASSATVNITILEPAVDFLYTPNSLVITRNETVNATSPMFGNDATADEWGISPALPEGLNFANGTVSGRPLVNMTATVFTVYANNSGGTGVAYLTITVLEPVATVVYVPENITLTRGEDNASIVPILGGGMVASWSISPELPDGMVFDNGSITGVPLVNSTNTTYTVMALNSGGVAFAFLNITVVEPVAILAFNESFLGTRGETLFNATVNNTGGMVATWEIEPALPKGVGLWNGWLYGTPLVNLSETTFTVWANNSGGSANITFTIEVIEPAVIIDYPEAEIILVNGVTRGRVVPVLGGGVADNWSIEPSLPPGLTFLNGYIIGVSTTNLSQTTYTVWANNSGGSASATFNLTVNQPTYYARYPVTRVVLDINETMPTMTPIYYFGDNQNPVWSITPTLPEGLAFENGRISGTPTEVSNETNYTITVLGEMVPVRLFVILEVRAEANLTVESVRNETDVEQFVLPEPPEPESFDMYWLCFPVLLFLTLLGVAAINNFLALTAKDEDEDESETDGEDGDKEGAGD